MRPASSRRGGNPIDNEIERFIAARSARWGQLDQVLRAMQEKTLKHHGRDELGDLMRLYRLASSDLNQARSFTSNPELLERLNQLVGRAYRVIYQAAPTPLRRHSILQFFLQDAPQACRRQARWVALAAGAFSLGTLLGLVLVLLRPANGEMLIPRQFFTESPADRVAHIEEDHERIDSVSTAAAFGSSLYTHNIQVSFLAFALGAATLIGGLALMFYNGLILGALAGLYLIDGVGTFFIAWVGPHGSLELPSIILAGAAGMCLGRAILVPGEIGRSQAMRLIMPDVVRMLFTACAVLVAAGLIEGSISQFSTKTISYGWKITLAAVLLSALLGWLFLTRSRRPHA
jgi:uncharacterized membrane protein SpoIIM required for sporulation